MMKWRSCGCGCQIKSNPGMWMSATQIQVPEFNGAVDLSCRAPPGANLVCPCEIYLAPGLPMWELSHMFSSYKRLLNVPPRTNLAFVSSSQIFQSQSVILLSDIFEVKASIWNLQASCLQSLWSCGVSVQALQLTLSTLLPMTGRSYFVLNFWGSSGFFFSCQIES